MKYITIIVLSLFLISCANEFHSTNSYSSSSFYHYKDFNFKFGDNIAIVQNDILLSSHYNGYNNVAQFLPSDNGDSKDDFISFLTRTEKPSISLSNIDGKAVAIVSYPSTNEVLFFAKNEDTQLFEQLTEDVVRMEHDENNANVQPGYDFGSSTLLIKPGEDIIFAAGASKGEIELNSGKKITSGFISVYILEAGATGEPSILKYQKDLPGNPISIKNFYNEEEQPWMIQENILFGKSMVINENCLVVGAPNFREKYAPEQKGGRIFIMNLHDSSQPIKSWTAGKDNKIKGDPQLGWSLALHGNNLVIGIPGYVNEEGVAIGAVNFFKLHDNCDFDAIQGIYSPTSNDENRFGHSVAISDLGLIIGAPGHDDPNDEFNKDIGAFYYYKLENDTWILQEFVEGNPPQYEILYSDLFK